MDQSPAIFTSMVVAVCLGILMTNCLYCVQECCLLTQNPRCPLFQKPSITLLQIAVADDFFVLAQIGAVFRFLPWQHLGYTFGPGQKQEELVWKTQSNLNRGVWRQRLKSSWKNLHAIKALHPFNSLFISGLRISTSWKWNVHNNVGVFFRWLVASNFSWMAFFYL